MTEFGYAERDITPPLGIYARNWGAAAFDNAIGIHKPLMLQCLVIGRKQERQRVLLTADLGWWKNNEDERAIRSAILSHFGWQEDQLLFCLSHTHAGPSICSADVGLPGGEYIIPYLDSVLDAAIACIEEARLTSTLGTLVWSSGVCSLATNRDLNVGGEFLVGFNASRKADNTLLIGQVYDTDDRLLMVICNYACHPTSFAHENRLISPDFVGELRATIATYRQVPCMFLQGASGDLAPRKQYVADPDIVDANGRVLGFSVLSAMAATDRPGTYWTFEGALLSGAPLALWKERPMRFGSNIKSKVFEVSVPFKELPAEEEIEREYQSCEDRVMKDRLWRKLNTRRSIDDRTGMKIPVWIWKLGDAFLVAQPNEAYSEYQQVVRSLFPRETIIFINMANGYLGYLPPADLYEHDMYAVWQTPYAAGSLETLIEETIGEIRKYLEE